MSSRAHRILGVPEDTDCQAVRGRYLELVRRFPPDREPEKFQEVQQAYEKLRDPRRRALARFLVDAEEPLACLADILERRFTGPEPWLAALGKEQSP